MLLVSDAADGPDAVDAVDAADVRLDVIDAKVPRR